MLQNINRRTLLGMGGSTLMLASSAHAYFATSPGEPPAGFESSFEAVNGTRLHYVRGGEGPPVLLLHGMPEDWTEYRAIMPRLARHHTVVAVDLPGIGRSSPASNGYEAHSLAADIHALARVLGLERPYIVGHDLGGIVTYGYVRRFPADLRGAMILDVPVPGVGGWEEATADLWHIGFIQAPGELAEKLITGRQAIYFDHDLVGSGFTPAQRAYYAQIYGAPQLHAAFEIYRGFPQDGVFNGGQTARNDVPLVVAVGARSFFSPFLPTFVSGFRAKGMSRVDGTRIPGAGHFVVADNPQSVSELIERNATI